MALALRTIRTNLPAAAAALRLIILFLAVLSIPLASAQLLGLTVEQTSSWVLALYALPGALSLALIFLTRQPLLLTGNLFVLIFIAQLGSQMSYPELIGAAVAAGAGVLVIGLLGLTPRLSRWVPVPIMFGLLAGAVLPFVIRIFTLLGDAPLLVSGTLAAYLVSRALLGERLPPIVPAIVAGAAIAAVTGQFGAAGAGPALAMPVLTVPVFSVPAILTVTPVLIVLIVLQANLPSVLYLHAQGYEPSELTMNTVSGLGTMLGSVLGPTGISLSLPATAIVAGPEAGEQALRYRAALIVSVAAVITGLLGGLAAELPTIVPSSLLLSLAGLAVVDVLNGALPQVTRGPLRLGPLFAFAIALSDMSLLGFGPYFWSLVVGTAVSFLLEREGWRDLRAEADSRSDRSAHDV